LTHLSGAFFLFTGLRRAQSPVCSTPAFLPLLRPLFRFMFKHFWLFLLEPVAAAPFQPILSATCLSIFGSFCCFPLEKMVGLRRLRPFLSYHESQTIVNQYQV
jgi:hypothetical protein